MKTIIATITVDIKFWALFPAVNINLHSKEFEIEWLCFGMYFSSENDDTKIEVNGTPDISVSA